MSLNQSISSAFKGEDFHFTFPDMSGMSLEQIKNWSREFLVDNRKIGLLWDEMETEEEQFQDGELYKNLVPEVGFKFIENADLNTIVDFPSRCLNLILQLRTIASSNAKKEWVNEVFTRDFTNFEKEMFIKFLSLVLSDVYTYDVTAKSVESIPFDNSGVSLFSSTLLKLEELGLGNILPKDKKIEISRLYAASDEVKRELIFMILDRDLKCKMQAKTFYELFKNSEYGKISIIPYQRCEKEDKFDSRATYPGMIQEKADGKFQNVIYSPEETFCLNRSGKKSCIDMTTELNTFNSSVGYLSQMWGIPVWMRGEALIKLRGVNTLGMDILDIPVLDRKIGNGLFNSYGDRFNTYKNLMKDIQSKIGKKGVNTSLLKLFRQLIEWKLVSENTIIQIWDMVPYNQYVGLSTNFTVKMSYDYANHFITSYTEWCKSVGRNPKLFLIHTEFAHDRDSVYTVYNYMLKRKKEGIIFKNLGAIIEHGTSTDGIIKFKDFLEGDMRVVGFIPGTGQFLGGIGSLICETECGLMTVNATGMDIGQKGFERVCSNDSALGIRLKEGWSNDCYNGSLVNLKFNGMSKDKSGKPSLSHPSIVEFRNDVTKAETLEEFRAKKRKPSK